MNKDGCQLMEHITGQNKGRRFRKTKGLANTDNQSFFQFLLVNANDFQISRPNLLYILAILNKIKFELNLNLVILKEEKEKKKAEVQLLLQPVLATSICKVKQEAAK